MPLSLVHHGLPECLQWAGVHPFPLFQSHLGGAQLAVGMGVEVHMRLDKGLCGQMCEGATGGFIY